MMNEARFAEVGRKSDICEICQECIPSRLKQFEWWMGGAETGSEVLEICRE